MKRTVVWLAAIVILANFPSCRRNTSGEPDEETPVEPGDTYYVSTSGSDSGPGSRESPWRTPGYAAGKLAPGDTLVILGGTYVLHSDEEALSPADGSPGHRITIRGEEGNRPVLAGRDNLNRAVNLSSCLTLENLEITSDDGAEFRDAISQVDRKVSDILLKDLYIHRIDEFGVDIGDVDRLEIRNCVISYTGFGSIGGPAAASSGWSRVVIDHCHLSYNGHYYRGGPGPSPYDRPDGFGIEPGVGPVEIRYTTAEHNRGDGLDSKAAGTYIHHCIVANNSCDGIKLWAGNSLVENCLIYGTGDGIGGSSPWAGLVIDSQRENDAFEVVNVTIHDNPARQAYPLYMGYGQGAAFSVLFRNCIVAGGYGAAYFGPRVAARIDHCLFDRPDDPVQVEANGRSYTCAEIEGGLLGTGNLCRPPLFRLPAWGLPGDYHLLPGSPAIDSGTAEKAPGSDLDDIPRPQGGGFDIGAYELPK
jgi:hypothetical protein